MLDVDVVHYSFADSPLVGFRLHNLAQIFFTTTCFKDVLLLFKVTCYNFFLQY